jgi:(S)-2-hydroxyglutarate dehydrogenase
MSTAASARIVVVGGGVVGLAVAFKLLQGRVSANVIVLEKEQEVGQHQTGHNSGVLHAGLYYRPGSAKARLAVAGLREMTAFCQEHGVAHDICGKLVLAADEGERPALEALADRGRQNGLVGLELLSTERMREIEPHAGGVAALRVPETGLVDYRHVAAVLAAQVVRNGGKVVTSARVRDVRRDRQGSWIVETTAGDFQAGYLITCAGLQADRMLHLTGDSSPVRIIPFRGEYYRLRPEREDLVRHLIYPVPDLRFPFLGVHFTRMIGGGVEAGPNAVLAFAREGYTAGRVNLRDMAEALTFPGLWRFVARHRTATVAELRRSFSRPRFAASLQRLVPEIAAGDLVPGGAGVRAQAMHPDGTLVEDFCFIEGPGVLHVLNAPSPAATASLAIGGEIAGRVRLHLAT